MNDIFERAALLGIETEYRDGFGQLRKVDPQVVYRLLDALSERPDAAKPMLPRTIVVRGDDVRPIHLATAEGLPLHWEIFLDGRIAEGQDIAPLLKLPRGLPNGILRLRVTVIGPADPQNEETSLIVCPGRTYQGHETAPRRMWALAVQLYALRSRRNWGHGDFSDLLALIELAADLGVSAIGLNPLHALFDDRLEEASPYFPNSRLFLNPLYIDVEAMPEFPGRRAAGLEQEIEQFRSNNVIDYQGIAKAKLRALALAYDVFRNQGSKDRRSAFERFRQTHLLPLARFACFEFLRRKFTRPWWEWPQEWRRADERALGRLRQSEEVAFFEFVQWAAHEQLEHCRRRACEVGLPIGLYLDIAVGVRTDGFDAWCDRDAVLSGMAVGAPPDMLNSMGQNWGLAGFNPLGLEHQRFAPFRQLLQASMQYAGAVRLDHVLGLKRLYLIPHGMPANQGAYIRLPFEALLAVTALASVQNSCVVVGEDLGTVPENFRETLNDWGIWSYQVMLFERSGGAFAAPESYRENALVTFGTHDTPTFAGWREHHDLAIKRALDMDPGETDDDRHRALGALRDALTQRGIDATDFASVAKYLADTRSRLLVISMEDLLGIRDQVNLPGTMNEHPNWRQPLPVLLEDMRSQQGLTSMAAIMRSAGRSWR